MHISFGDESKLSEDKEDIRFVLTVKHVAAQSEQGEEICIFFLLPYKKPVA